MLDSGVVKVEIFSKVRIGFLKKRFYIFENPFLILTFQFENRLYKSSFQFVNRLLIFEFDFSL